MFGRPVTAAVLLLALAGSAAEVQAQDSLRLTTDMVLDREALHLPVDASYDRAINGLAFQDAPLVSRNGYQYAVWYTHDNAGDESIFIARRDLSTNAWEPFDTGRELSNGKDNWDAHNVVSLGISGDGRMHVAYDMHADDLRYFNSDLGIALNPGGDPWSRNIFNPNQEWLVYPGKVVARVTYPEFSLAPNGDLVLTYRVGGSGNGDVYLTTYRVDTGTWDPPHQILNRYGSYTDRIGTSNSRNGYLNALDIDSSGRIHISWTWREAPVNGVRGGNHDILYAYSDDGGDTWKNNEGKVIGTVGSPIRLDAPGTVIADLDRTNSLGNQQGQVVDLDGRVHVLVFHRRDEPGHEWKPSDGTIYDSEDSAHYHYFRDPDTRSWTRRRLPVTREVGSRPSIAYDRNGNVYAAYISPGDGNTGGDETEGDLVIAKATKAANYEDWAIVHVDARDFISEPFIDQDRLISDDVLSIFVQEFSTKDGVSGSPLHVLEFEVEAGPDEPGEDPELSISDVDAREGDADTTTFNFVVSLNAPGDEPVRFSYSTRAGGADAEDFTPVSGTAEIPAGSTRTVISVPVRGDTVPEPDEAFTLALSDIVGADVVNDEATGLILNDDDQGTGFLQFTSASYSVRESAGTATITISRSGGSNGAASVRFFTGDASAVAGLDYNNIGLTLNWADGETGTKSVTVKIGNDSIDESDEIVALNLNTVAGASLGPQKNAELTIVDDDNSSRGSVQFSSSSYTVDGGSPSATITLTRSGGSEGAVSVRIDTFNGTAVAGQDFVDLHQTVLWADGDDGSKTVNVSLIPDTVDEPNETVSLVLSSPIGVSIGSPPNATLTIIDDDTQSNPLAGTVQFSAGTYSVRETGGFVAITVTRLGGSVGAASVTVSTTSDSASSDSDYTATQRVLSWDDGDSTTRTVIVPVLDDGASEGTETFTVSLVDAQGVAVGGPSIASIDIFDNEQTALDTSPDSFNFKDRDGVDGETYIVSNVVKVSGLSPGASAVLKIVRQSGGNASFSVNYRAFSGTATSVKNGDEIRLRNRVPGNDGTARVAVSIGNQSDSWAITTDH